MAIELTEWYERQKAKQPGTFRASILEYSFEHLFSIVLATFFDHSFVLCRRYQLPMLMKKKGWLESTYPFRVDVITTLVIRWESVCLVALEPVPSPSLRGLQ